MPPGERLAGQWIVGPACRGRKIAEPLRRGRHDGVVAHDLLRRWRRPEEAAEDERAIAAHMPAEREAVLIALQWRLGRRVPRPRVQRVIAEEVKRRPRHGVRTGLGDDVDGSAGEASTSAP